MRVPSLRFPKISPVKTLKIAVVDNPLSFDAPPHLQESPRISVYTLYRQKVVNIPLHFCRWWHGTIFIRVFVGPERRTFSETECVSAVQGHPIRFPVRNFGHILHRFWDTANYWIQIVNLSYPTLKTISNFWMNLLPPPKSNWFLLGSRFSSSKNFTKPDRQWRSSSFQYVDSCLILILEWEYNGVS